MHVLRTADKARHGLSKYAALRRMAAGFL